MRLAQIIYLLVFEQNPEIYKQRQAIVDYPFGTIKLQWGFSYILSKNGKERASADVGFMFIVYNLRRIINIIGISELKKYLQELIFIFFQLWQPIKHDITIFCRQILFYKMKFFTGKYLFN